MRFEDFAEVNPSVHLETGLEYPYVGMADVIPGRRYVSATETRVYDGGGTRFEDGDVLLARITPSLEHGKIAQYRARSDEQSAFGSTEFFVFRHRQGTSDRDYLYYLALTERVRKPAELSMTGASGRQRADLETVKRLELDIPFLSTQRKVGAILSAYDDLIENNARRIGILEEMAQMLYHEWFVHFRFPGHKNVEMVPFDVDHPDVNGDFPHLTKIPNGWHIQPLGDLAKRKRRGADPQELLEDTPYIGLGHMPKESIALSNWGHASETKSRKYRFEKGEILFGRIRPYFHKVGVAPVDGVGSTDIIVIAPKEPESFSLVLGCVSSGRFVDYATQTSSGTKMPRAKWKILVDYPVPIPPQPILERYSALIEGIVAQINNSIFRNRVLRQSRDLLLPRLVSGELDVGDLPIDVTLPEA